MADEPLGQSAAAQHASGISLHVGLNLVDPDHYQGWDGELAGCEADADDMEALAMWRGFATTKLLSADATADAVRDAISAAAAELKAGDIFFLTYSGHGSQVPDVNNEEEDRLDETWVLYDRELIDDELWALWATFPPGVRIALLSDSCHSGTVTRGARYRETYLPHTVAIGAAGDVEAEQVRTKNMPYDVERRTYMAHRGLYNGIQFSLPPGGAKRSEVGADVLLISGCADNQLSGDTPENGIFTGTLKRVWRNGAFEGSYRELWAELSNLMPASQSPNYYRVGAVDEAFDRQRPFTI